MDKRRQKKSSQKGNIDEAGKRVGNPKSQLREFGFYPTVSGRSLEGSKHGLKWATETIYNILAYLLIICHCYK
jgi:hypothetical protein